jgi:hypothetical protein
VTWWGRQLPLYLGEGGHVDLRWASPHESRRTLKLTGRAINVISTTVPEYLRLSKFLITFDRTDHPNSIPTLGEVSPHYRPAGWDDPTH